MDCLTTYLLCFIFSCSMCKSKYFDYSNCLVSNCSYLENEALDCKSKELFDFS